MLNFTWPYEYISISYMDKIQSRSGSMRNNFIGVQNCNVFCSDELWPLLCDTATFCRNQSRIVHIHAIIQLVQIC